MYDTIIIGAGTAGAVAARRLAEKGGRNVLVLEKRSHIGGNCYDREDEHGILIHPYGPHIYHTSIESVHEYLSRFTEWYYYGHEVAAKVGEKLIPVPFNFNTMEMVYGHEKAERLKKKLIACYGEGIKVPILKLREHEDREIREIGEYVYENIYLHYTVKQWGKKPEEIDPAVTARVPVHLSYDNRYFQDKYQGIPLEGYTGMFEKMLDHPSIKVETGADAKKRIELKEGSIFFDGEVFGGSLIYTGAADELFDKKYGALPYRTLMFSFEHYNTESFQSHNVVNYTVDEDYTRISEYKKLTGQKAEGTTISKEYPLAYDASRGHIPYYPVTSEESSRIYERYKKEAENIPNLYLIGRLAEYQYYNIDAMVLKAMEVADRMIATL